MIAPFRTFQELICTIPGISAAVADVVIAETGGDMSRFPTANHLASWAGTCPGSYESAGRVKSTKTRPGNSHLKGALGIVAMANAHSKNTYLSVKYRRLAARRGTGHHRRPLHRPQRRLLNTIHKPSPFAPVKWR